MTQPDEFYAFIGGYMGPSYRVELRDGLIEYTRSGDAYETEETAEIEPTDDQWAPFLNVLDDVDFWNRKRRYEDSQILDGTHWTIRIAVHGRRHESSGSNDYPGPSLEEQLSEGATDERPFKQFTAAVEELLGGRDFR